MLTVCVFCCRAALCCLSARLHQSVKNFIVKLRHEFQARHSRPARAVYVLESAVSSKQSAHREEAGAADIAQQRERAERWLMLRCSCVVLSLCACQTLGEVIRTFVQERIHRVYICDSHQSKKPVGVVTLQDVLREIIDA